MRYRFEMTKFKRKEGNAVTLNLPGTNFPNSHRPGKKRIKR